MAGPPPAIDPARRNARVGPVLLPAKGREGPPPAWPLEKKPRAAAKLWAELWALPQAVMWERLVYTRVVARYVQMVLAHEEEPTAAGAAQLVALEDRLGLTTKAMRHLLWEIAVDEVAAKRDSGPSTSARGRLKAVG